MSSRQYISRGILTKLTVCAVVDSESFAGCSSPLSSEDDQIVVTTLQRLAKNVLVHPFVGALEMIGYLERTRPDLIFNLTEQVSGNRNADSHIAALLDLTGIPYTGSGPRGLVICRDKALSKLLARREGFQTPDFSLPLGGRSSTDFPNFPLVVKPRFGDASEGISQASLVRTPRALAERIRFLRHKGIVDIICEDFVPGREVFVGVLGEQLMPGVIVVGRTSRHVPLLVSERFKFDSEYRRRWKIRVDRIELSDEQENSLRAFTSSTFKALDMRHYGRLDLKLTPSGDWVFLEANPNSSLVRFERWWNLGNWTGVSLAFLLEEIARLALQEV